MHATCNPGVHELRVCWPLANLRLPTMQVAGAATEETLELEQKGQWLAIQQLVATLERMRLKTNQGTPAPSMCNLAAT